MRDFHLPGRSPVLSTTAMCATSHPLASLAAIRLLEAGGNAVDAAIAAAVLLGICEPQMTGLGGDCFVLLKPPGGEEIVALNGSGRAPKALEGAALRARGWHAIPDNSVHSVTVPGAVDAFCRLSADWGRLGIAASLAPAIRAAREGVPVAPRTAFDWRRAANRLQGAARRFYLADDAPLETRDVFRHPRQGEVLEKIAREGREGFYAGEVAEDMVASLRALGGLHTLEDFAETRADYGVPISGRYGDFELVEHPPNGQGATAILMAGILSHFDLAALPPFGAERAHLEAEAARLAYDARNRFLADPAVPGAQEALAHMLSDETAARLAALIDPDRAMADPASAADPVHARFTSAPHKDTVCLSVVDGEGMAVSLIYSIYHPFGSGIASERYGILFQNRGAGFTLAPGHPNEAMGGKRPMHTIIPAMLRRDGKVIAAFGVMGGPYQPAGHVRFLTNIADYGMEPQEAIDGPRSFPDEGALQLERGYRPEVHDALAAMGHRVTIPEAPLGGAQAVFIHHDRGVLEGASDPRKDGCALGF